MSHDYAMNGTNGSETWAEVSGTGEIALAVVEFRREFGVCVATLDDGEALKIPIRARRRGRARR